MFCDGPFSRGSVVFSTIGLPALAQGLTLVHFSAQLERFLWDRGRA